MIFPKFCTPETRVTSCAKRRRREFRLQILNSNRDQVKVRGSYILFMAVFFGSNNQERPILCSKDFLEDSNCDRRHDSSSSSLCETPPPKAEFNLLKEEEEEMEGIGVLRSDRDSGTNNVYCTLKSPTFY